MKIKGEKSKMGLQLVFNGKAANTIDNIYSPIFEAIKKHGLDYPEYLTTKEIELTKGSVEFLDRLAQKIKC